LAGHAVVQLIDDGEQMHVIECNPRVGGASTLSMMVGLPTISWFLSEASGADPADHTVLSGCLGISSCDPRIRS
jgi:carbamoyl-phosphate synthase large subunit